MTEPGSTTVETLQRRIEELDSLNRRHREAEESLRVSEEKYRSLMDNLPGTVARIDTEGKFLFVNRRYLELTGLSEEQIIGHSAEILAPFVDPESFPAMVEGVVRAMREQTRVETEMWATDVHGRRLCLLQIALPWHTPNGQLGGVEILTQEITDRKDAEAKLRLSQEALEETVKKRTAELEEANRALQEEIAERTNTELELRQSEERYRMLFEATSDPVLVFSVDATGRPGMLIEANHKALETLGYTREEILTLTPFDLTAPENLPPLAEIVEQTTVVDSFQGERLWVTKHGGRILVEISARRIVLDGKPAGIVVAHDVTERKRVEEALRESEEKFRNLAEKSPNMIFINKQGRVVYANEKSLQFLGYTREELYSPEFDFRTLIAPEYHDLIAAAYKCHSNGEDVEPYEYPLVAKDGHRISAFTTTKLISFKGATAILGIVTDVTAERQLERQFAELEMIQRMQLGHDLHDGLGQYLTGISLRCKALEQKIESGGTVGKDDIVEIGRLVSLSVRQTHDVSEGLSPSALKQGDLPLALRALAAQTQKVLGLKCTVRCHEDARVADEVAAAHLYRIAQEALTNAARHGKATSVTLSLRPGKRELTLTVEDNGKGIDTKAAAGDGMGLRIMHYRARVMGGVLEIGRRPTRGTFVRCSVPLETRKIP